MDFNQNLFQYRIIHINIRGIRSNKVNLEHYLEEHGFPEIVTLNETMLNVNKNIKIKGYYCAARREPIGGSGKQDIVEIDFLKSQFQEEVLGIEILGNKDRPNLNIVTYYNPPGDRVNPGIFCKTLYNNISTVITGDLNCKHLAWGSNTTDPQGSHLADTLEDQNWLFLNDGSKTT